MGNDAVAVRPRLRNGRQAAGGCMPRQAAGAGSAGSVGLGPARLASPRWPGAPAARGRGGTQPVGLPAPCARGAAREVLGGVARALDTSTHHAIARLPRSAVFPKGCVYSAPVFSVFAKERNSLHVHRLAV